MRPGRPFHVGALIFCIAFGARAEPRDAAAAETLFREARELMKAGKYADACPKLRASQDLDPGVGTLLNLGECYEKAGLLASAWASFVEAEGEAQKAGDTKRSALAHARAEKLASKLPRLTIQVPESSRVEGLVVKRGDVVVAESSWGSAIPVDPGSVTVSASAPGRATWKKSVEVGAGGETIVVPALEPGTPASEPEGPVTAPDVQVTRDTAPKTHSSTQKTLGLVAVGLGVVGVGVGSYFGLRARSKWDDAKAHCTRATSGCDPTGMDLGDQAGSAADVSTIALAAGGVLVAGGLVLWLTAPSASPERAARLGIGMSPAGVSVRGTY